MNQTVTRRDALLVSMGLGLNVAGCATWGSKHDPVTPPVASSFKSLQLAYRSDTGRIISQAAGGNAVPNLHEATLVLTCPHPEGMPDHALAVVHLEPMGDNAGGAFTLNIAREEETPDAAPAAAKHYAEIPLWQVEALVKKLRDDNFFRRSRSLQDEIHLSVKIDEEAFGKKYRAVPELDALIVQICREGRTDLASARNSGDGLRRLPTVR